MTLSICIPFHLRGDTYSEAYAIAFKHYASLPFTVHLCGSEEQISRKFAMNFTNDTTHYVEVPQGPLCKKSAGDDILRKKFNDSLRTLPDTEWKCLVGADDIIPEYAFNEFMALPTDKPIMAGVSMKKNLYIVDVTGKHRPAQVWLRYANALKLLPGVNAYNRLAMQATKQKPYTLPGCETGAEKYIEQNGGQVIGCDGFVMMTKGNHTLNSFEKTIGVHKHKFITEQQLHEQTA